MSLISSVKFSEDIPKHVQKLLERIADYSQKDQWEIALTLSTIALEDLEEALESDSRDVGSILSIVGYINTKIDKYDEAKSLWQRAVSVLEKYDNESNVTVTILQNLVESFIKDEKYEEAEFFGKKAIEIHEKCHAIDAIELIKQKVTISEVYLQLKNPDEAKRFLRAALPVSIEKYGISSVEVEKIFEFLEIAYLWRDSIAESKESLKNSNEIADAIQLDSLGMLCEDENFQSRAVRYYHRAIKIYESKGLSDDSRLADISLKLGKCYLKLGIRFGSRLYLEKSRVIYKKTLPDDDPVMLDAKIHLALCCVKTARLMEARKIYREILSQVYTDGSGVSIIKLAEDYEKSGEPKVPILNGKPNIIDCALKNLSALYVLDGKYKAAKILQDFGESKNDLIENNRI